MKHAPLILSLAYQSRIENLCQQLYRLGLKYFVCYIVFSNEQKFVLSNMFNMLTPYYVDGYYKEDYSFARETTEGVTHYLCEKTKSISDNFQGILENVFNIYRTYYIIRNCPECQFVFGAIKDNKPNNYQLFYKQTLNKFEDFCCDFISGSTDIIKQYNPTYHSALILNDSHYLKSIIKSGVGIKEKLTAREMECLYWAANGKSSEQTAKELKISKPTVESYRNEAKRKLNAANITHAVFEAIKNGYIGAFDRRWEMKDNSPLKNFSVVACMQEAEKIIEGTNLYLLNTR